GDEVDAIATLPPELGDRVTLLPFRDNFVSSRRDLSLLVEADDAMAATVDWKGRTAPLGEQESLHHHAIVSGGRLAGNCEYDADGARVVWRSFRRLGKRELRRVELAVGETEETIRTELGDLKFYALDTPRGRRERIAALERLR